MSKIIGAKIIGIEYNDRKQIVEITLDNGKSLYPDYDLSTDDRSIEIEDTPCPSLMPYEEVMKGI